MVAGEGSTRTVREACPSTKRLRGTDHCLNMFLDSPSTALLAYCLGIAQRSKAVVVLLSRGIPESEVDGLPIDHYVRAEAFTGQQREVMECTRVVSKCDKHALWKQEGQGQGIHVGFMLLQKSLYSDIPTTVDVVCHVVPELSPKFV